MLAVEPAGELEQLGRRRLEQRGSSGRVDRAGAVDDHRLVAQAAEVEVEQKPDLGRRLAEQDAYHTTMVVPRRGFPGGIGYEAGMKRPLVLVIDDEEDIRSLVRELLERAQYDVREAPDGREGLRALYESPPDLVVLDVAMPELDGWATLERIRDLSDVPVLMLTARAQELEKVRGLKAGADDYVTKPFGRQELVARVEALLRRGAERGDVRERYDDGAVAIDYAARAVTVDGELVALTPLEYRLLAVFVEHPAQVLSPDQLLDLAWRDHAASRDQVKLYVGYLRRKLGDRAGLIETMRGFGYRYRRPAS